MNDPNELLHGIALAKAILKCRIKDRGFVKFHPPQRDRKPRQPPVWPCAGLVCTANSSLTASSSIPGSSGGLTMGITGGMVATLLFPRSCRCRNSGAGVTGADSACGGDGAGFEVGAG